LCTATSEAVHQDGQSSTIGVAKSIGLRGGRWQQLAPLRGQGENNRQWWTTSGSLLRDSGLGNGEARLAVRQDGTAAVLVRVDGFTVSLDARSGDVITHNEDLETTRFVDMTGVTSRWMQQRLGDVSRSAALQPVTMPALSLSWQPIAAGDS